MRLINYFSSKIKTIFVFCWFFSGFNETTKFSKQIAFTDKSSDTKLQALSFISVTEIIEPPRKRIRPTTPPPTTNPTTQIPVGGQDIVVVMDSSVKPGRFRTFKTFVQRLAENLNIDSGEVRLGLVSYSTRPSLQWNLRDFNRKDQIINRAERITYNAGQRNTADAINFARTRMFVRSNGDRSYARNFIILLTGEKESLDRYDAYEAAYEAERDGINLFTIGYNLDDSAEISEISTYPLRTYRHLVSEESELLELPGVLQYTLNDSKSCLYISFCKY